MKKKVLIVDDETDILEVLKVRLEANDYDVIAAQDGEEALWMTKQEHPDLVVLDIMMPLMSGYEVCARIKQGDDAVNIPVIMLSAKTGYQNKKMAIQCGADAYVPKPCSSDILLDEIDRLIVH